MPPPRRHGTEYASGDRSQTMPKRRDPPLARPLGGLPPSATVADAAYVPLEPPRLAAARARGNRAVDGLGMLLHQARPGFEAWFGVAPEVTPALREAIEATL